MRALLAKSSREQRRAFIGWAIGIGAMALMYASFYPSIKGTTGQIDQYIKNLPEALRNLIGTDYSTAPGYLRAEVFSILGPILVMVCAIGVGGKAIAGEEETGTLDLLLSMPVHRRSVLISKFIAMMAGLAFVCVVLWATIITIGPLFDLRVGLSDVAAACLLLFLLGLSYGSIALAIGSATGRKALAYAITGGLGVVAYIVNVIAPSVSWLRPLRPWSQFRWYLEPDPLVSGIHPAGAAVLLSVTAVFLLLALIGFERRDLAS